MKELKHLLLSNENWLMERILFYAKQQNYTKYTSTLVEAWRLSISGLSGAILKAIDDLQGCMPEFSPDEDYTKNPIAEFGIIEANRHRKRGIRLDMFLGLLKYYRQTYQDLVREKINRSSDGAKYGLFIVRCFDLFELALCVEWNRIPEDKIITDLQQTNRLITNEKNLYLTLFESLSDPAFFIDEKNRIKNLNTNAAKLIELEGVPGAIYYSQAENDRNGSPSNKIDVHTILEKPIYDILPWLENTIKKSQGKEQNLTHEELMTQMNDTKKYFFITVSTMLDISGKFTGAVVVLSDITERKIMEKKIRKLASIDPLTGINNRRSFMEQAASEISRSQRYHHPLSVLMMDIDHFKKINDSYGHQMGDLALQAFTVSCLKSLRENDLFGRLGGEEFAALLVETDQKKAIEVADRLRKKLSTSIVHKGHVSFNFQVSIGVATLKETDTSIEKILNKADQALYKAKNSGRNKVAFSG